LALLIYLLSSPYLVESGDGLEEWNIIEVTNENKWSIALAMGRGKWLMTSSPVRGENGLVILKV